MTALEFPYCPFAQCSREKDTPQSSAPFLHLSPHRVLDFFVKQGGDFFFYQGFLA